MTTGTIITMKIDEVKMRDGHVISECFTIDFAKTPTRPFNEKTLDGIIRAVAQFGEDLKSEPHCYRLSVRLDKGQRAPNGFRALAEARNNTINIRVNTEKALCQETV